MASRARRLPPAAAAAEVANVAARSADARQSRFGGQNPRHLVDAEFEALHDEQHRERVDVAGAVVLRQARLRRHAETGIHRYAAANGRHAGTPAQMAGNVAQAGPAEESAARARWPRGGWRHGSRSAARPVPRASATARRRWWRPRPSSRRKRSRTAPPAAGRGRAFRKARMAAMYGGLCAGAWKENSSMACEHRVIHQVRAAQRAGMNRFEPDRVEAGRVADIRQTAPYGRVVVGASAARLADPLHPPFGQHPFVRHVEQAVLEGGAADIGDEELHGLTDSDSLRIRFGQSQSESAARSKPGAVGPTVPRVRPRGARPGSPRFALCYNSGE